MLVAYGVEFRQPSWLALAFVFVCVCRILRWIYGLSVCRNVDSCGISMLEFDVFDIVEDDTSFRLTTCQRHAVLVLS